MLTTDDEGTELVIQSEAGLKSLSFPNKLDDLSSDG
jgi:hypothetical protein